MIVISSLKNGACTVEAGNAKFAVFPDALVKDGWTLLPHPEEEFTNPKIVSWPGEYDFSGIAMRAIGQEQGKQVSFVCTSESVCMAFIGSPVLDWTDAEVEKLGDVDVLVVAADQPKKVQDLVESVDPRIVVLFDVEKGDLAGTAKACGQQKVESVKELKVKASSLPQDTREVVVLG